MKNLKLKNVLIGIAALSAVLLCAACKQRIDKKDKGANLEKFAIRFSVEGDGGSLKAEVEGTEINSGAEVEKGKTVIFTAKADSGFKVKEWIGAVQNKANSNTASLKVISAANVKVKFKSSSDKKEVKIKEFKVCASPVDMKRETWSVLIPNTESKVEKNKVSISFEGEAENVMKLMQALTITEIDSINEGETKEFSISVAETEKYESWSKNVKVRRSYKMNQEKGDLKFVKLIIFDKDYTAYANEQIRDPDSLIQTAGADIPLKSISGDKTFRFSDIKVEYSFRDGSMIIPSAKISLKYIDNGILKNVSESDVYNLSDIVKPGEDAIFVLHAVPNVIGGYKDLSFRFTFFVENDKADLLYLTVPKTSAKFNKDAGISENIDIRKSGGKLDIMKDVEHDGSPEKPISVKAKIPSGIDISKITDLKINISYMAALKYGADKDNLLSAERGMVKYANAPLFLQITSEDKSIIKCYLLALEKETPSAPFLPESFVKVPVPPVSFPGITPAYQLYKLNGIQWKGVFLGSRNVKLSPYAIDKYEVTYKLWHEVRVWAESNGYVFANKGKEGSMGVEGAVPSANKNHPVTGIGWRDAVVWCNAYTQKMHNSGSECIYKKSSAAGEILKDSTSTDCETAFADMGKKGFRLPTEAEWEFAARYQGDGSKEEHKINAEEYGTGLWFTKLNSVSGASKPTGFEKLPLPAGETWENLRDEAAKYAVYGLWWDGEEEDNSDQIPAVTKTAVVGSKEANSLGIFDMSGNTWEWCFDIYSADAMENDAAYTQGSDVVNPQGAAIGEARVFRGGSYSEEAGYCAVGRRSYKKSMDILGYTIGLRLVCSAE